jgi:hypothetical protein
MKNLLKTSALVAALALSANAAHATASSTSTDLTVSYIPAAALSLSLDNTSFTFDNVVDGDTVAEKTAVLTMSKDADRTISCGTFDGAINGIYLSASALITTATISGACGDASRTITIPAHAVVPLDQGTHLSTISFSVSYDTAAY